MKIKDEEIQFSIDLKDHPVLTEKSNYKNIYLAALRYFVNVFRPENPVTLALLRRYETTFCPSQSDSGSPAIPGADDIKPLIQKISRIRFRGFRLFSCRYVFFADCLFLCGGNHADKAETLSQKLKEYFQPKYHQKLDAIWNAIYHDAPLPSGMKSAEKMISQFRENIRFLSKPVKTILMTATVSAGKSTFINAITGKPLARTAQAACTGNLHIFLDKPFEDGFITLINEEGVFLDIEPERVFQSEAQGNCRVSYCFHTVTDASCRFRMIDTPGVNSVIYDNHRGITIDALRNQAYDQLVYLFRADGLGREEDLAYLKRVSDIVPKEKMIFVVNKLDLFKMSEDSIQESLDGVRGDLHTLGYENPVLCPFSAYFAYLIKQKMRGQKLSEDEEDDFSLYAKKFRRADFDLSRYYQNQADFSGGADSGVDNLLELSVKCGLYHLEKLLFDT